MLVRELPCTTQFQSRAALTIVAGLSGPLSAVDAFAGNDVTVVVLCTFAGRLSGGADLVGRAVLDREVANNLRRVRAVVVIAVAGDLLNIHVGLLGRDRLRQAEVGRVATVVGDNLREEQRLLSEAGAELNPSAGLLVRHAVSGHVRLIKIASQSALAMLDRDPPDGFCTVSANASPLGLVALERNLEA